MGGRGWEPCLRSQGPWPPAGPWGHLRCPGSRGPGSPVGKPRLHAGSGAFPRLSWEPAAQAHVCAPSATDGTGAGGAAGRGAGPGTGAAPLGDRGGPLVSWKRWQPPDGVHVRLPAVVALWLGLPRVLCDRNASVLLRGDREAPTTAQGASALPAAGRVPWAGAGGRAPASRPERRPTRCWGSAGAWAVFRVSAAHQLFTRRPAVRRARCYRENDSGDVVSRA